MNFSSGHKPLFTYVNKALNSSFIPPYVVWQSIKIDAPKLHTEWTPLRSVFVCVCVCEMAMLIKITRTLTQKHTHAHMQTRIALPSVNNNKNCKAKECDCKREREREWERESENPLTLCGIAFKPPHPHSRPGQQLQLTSSVSLISSAREIK